MKLLLILLLSLSTAYALEVDPRTKPTITLSWTAPTLNTDNTKVSAPLSYRVYMRDSVSDWKQVMLPTTKTTMVHSVVKYSDGAYRFAVRVIDKDGAYSSYSSFVSVNIKRSVKPSKPQSVTNFKIIIGGKL